MEAVDYTRRDAGCSALGRRRGGPRGGSWRHRESSIDSTCGIIKERGRPGVWIALGNRIRKKTKEEGISFAPGLLHNNLREPPPLLLMHHRHRVQAKHLQRCQQTNNAIIQGPIVVLVDSAELRALFSGTLGFELLTACLTGAESWTIHRFSSCSIESLR